MSGRLRSRRAITEDQSMAELEANAWLQKRFEQLFSDHEDAIRDRLAGVFGKNAQRARTNKEVWIEERVQEMKGLIRGRLLRPVLGHIYRLTNPDLTGEQLKKFALVTGYNEQALLYHHRQVVGPELPQAFLRTFLVKAMDGDISDSAANNLVTLLLDLGLAARTPCIKGNGSYVLVFSDKMLDVYEDWMERKRMYKSDENVNLKLQNLAASFLAGLLLLSAVSITNMDDSKSTAQVGVALADATSELEIWKTRKAPGLPAHSYDA